MRPGRPVVMVDGETREVVRRYPSVKAAAESNGVQHGTMYIRCQRGAIRAGRPYFRFEDEFDPAEDVRTPSRRLTPPDEEGDDVPRVLQGLRAGRGVLPDDTRVRGLHGRLP